MPTTFSDIVPVRRVAVGDCSGPLGSGFDALARSAYASLLRADWSQSADPPFLPVHDNGQTANKTIPRGDAWKCSYGYDAAARTERSACGAVCYTFALPGDAYSPNATAYSTTTNYEPGDRAKYDGTVYECTEATSGAWDSSAWEEVEVADISTVALSLTGDRYLDAGVDLYLVPSASPTPPTILEILALTPAGTYCATSDQSPTPPNERHGVTEAVSVALDVAAQPYIHVALLLHDYTTNRGAWIEGGAMLEGATATIAFSREVSPDPRESVRILRVISEPPASNTPPPVKMPIAALVVDYHVYGYGGGAVILNTDSGKIRSDIGEALRQVAEGRLTPYSMKGFMVQPRTGVFDDFVAAILTPNETNAWYYSAEFVSTFYFSPKTRIDGMSVGFTFNQFAGSDFQTGRQFRIGMAQVDEVPSEDGNYRSVDYIRQIFSGVGDDIIGIADVGLDPTQSDARVTASIPIAKSPEKPYMALCIVPLDPGPGAGFGYSATNPFPDGILVATPTA